MRCVLIILLTIAFGVASARAADPGSVPDRAYTWLKNHQDENKTGIVGNQEGDNFAGLYTNALAAICFLHQGDVDRAERIFDFYARHFEREFAPGGDTPGGFPQFADAGTGELRRDTDRWVGDNAWLLIALNHHHRKTGKSDYAAMREGVARWLISLQDAEGGIAAGFNKNGPIGHHSTEGNLDCYAALIDYPKERASVKHWLDTKMWVAADRRFKTGSTVEDSALDTCSWALGALGKQYAVTFDYAEKTWSRTDTTDATKATVSGFGDKHGSTRIWLEGTGEMVVAYQVAGREKDAARYLAELEKAMIASPKWPDLVGLPCHTSDQPWEGGTRLIFVPSQTWYLLASWGFNPMAEPKE